MDRLMSAVFMTVCASAIVAWCALLVWGAMRLIAG